MYKKVVSIKESMDNPKNKNIKNIEAGERVKFKGMTDQYGRAYWYVGAEREENGEIKALYLIPGQQPDKDQILKYEPSRTHRSYLMNLSPELLRMEDKKERLTHFKQTYCATHDLVEDAFCMPASSGQLRFNEYGSGIEIKIFRGGE